MNPTANASNRKAAWRLYLEWLYNATTAELEQLERALRHLPARMSLMQAIEWAMTHRHRRSTAMPASLMALFCNPPAAQLVAA